MRVRRCAMLVIESRERLEFDLACLRDGGDGLRTLSEWIAMAPHIESEVIVSMDEIGILGSVSPSRWSPYDSLAAEHPSGPLERLLANGLLIAEGSATDAKDAVVREARWRSASAVMHYTSRWAGVDTEAAQERLAETLGCDLLDHLGPAPPAVREHVDASRRLALAPASPTPLDALLDGRVTCRNYDSDRALPGSEFAAVLYRAYGARHVDDYAPGVQLLKKGVPSAGGLHPTEAYLLVQRVEGIAPGLYHYHAVDHALEPIRGLDASEASALARTFVGAQSYFAEAQVLVIPVSRFRRNFWKYRNHAKAYRALILDVGHLSQAMYLAATELGLAAFITAAINEVDIEQAFGLDPLEEGPLAVCGFGIRGPERREIEFDPLGRVWPAG